MRVLVTGGLGVNGSWVTRKLVQQGHHTVVFENRPDPTLVPDVVDDITVVRGDVNDLAALVRALNDHRIERVVHMAAMVTGFQQDQLNAFRVNALGTVQVLEAARIANVDRVVYASSRAVYGDATGEHDHPTYKPFREDDPVRPKYVYDVCKVASEGMGRNYSDAYGIGFVALRFAHIIGPGKPQRYGSLSLSSSLVEDPLAGKPVRIPKGGEQRDDVIYVDDVAQGVVAATLHDAPAYDLYNISRGVATTLHDLADAVRKHLPEADIEIGPGLDYHETGANWYGPLDNTRAREDLGFAPRFDLDAAVADYIDAKRRLGL